jgi:serine/threonine protein kinase
MSETRAAAAGETLVREAIADSTQEVLNRGRWGNPDVLLVGTSTGSVVVKDFAPRSLWVRRGFGRWLIDREARIYRRLAGLPCVPRLLRRLDRDAIVIEYRPGVLLSRSLAGSLPTAFLSELDDTISAMHQRGVVHLDLRHRSNILAGADGHPVVIDFASALHFDPARRIGRLGIRLFGWFDRRAMQKWRVRLDRSLQSAASDSTSDACSGAPYEASSGATSEPVDSSPGSTNSFV